jgi:hypothetical protein
MLKGLCLSRDLDNEKASSLWGNVEQKNAKWREYEIGYIQ